MEVSSYSKVTPDPELNNLHKIASYESGKLIIIPVVVHIIFNNSKATNISDDQVYSQIRVLNEDFRKSINTNGFNTEPIGADVGVEFCLASLDPLGNHTEGINRIYHPRDAWNLSDEQEMKALGYWPSDQYLNIWVTNLVVDQGIGYARYPTGANLDGISPYEYGAQLDGVTIHYQAFGTKGAAVYPYNLGRTATHETGHWLGLLHTWGDTFCGEDYVEDTPYDEAPNEGKDCVDSSFCTSKRVQDMTNNYLDFSPDRCMNLFTQGQKERIWEAIERSPRRRSLVNSQGCKGQQVMLNTRVYPIPATGTINIEFLGSGNKTALIEWYNIQGHKFEEKRIETGEPEVFAYDITHKPQGLYILRISNDNSRKTYKVIIQ